MEQDKIKILLRLYKAGNITKEEFKLLSVKDVEYLYPNYPYQQPQITYTPPYTVTCYT
jgi:hypothetical protein